jgi:hypothetical protein
MARGRGRKKKEKKPPVEWVRHYVIEKDVEDLVEKIHTHLRAAKIVVLAKPKAGKRHGRVLITATKRASEATAALLKDEIGDVHYVIEIGKDAWDTLSQDRKKLVLDRALCYCAGQDPDKGVWKLRGPDVEDFTEIIKRHGLWTGELEIFAKEAAAQLELLEGKA